MVPGLSKDFDEFTEANHPPSQHGCYEYPVLATDESSSPRRIVVVCLHCQTVWLTGIRDLGKDYLYRALQIAEERYGGDPKKIRKDADQPLDAVYHIRPGYKRCSGCRQVLWLEDFANCKRTKDGKNPKCRQCCAVDRERSRLGQPTPRSERRVGRRASYR